MLRSIIAIIIITLSIVFVVIYTKSMYFEVETSRANLEKITSTFDDVKKIDSLINATTITMGRVPQTSLDRLNAFIPEIVDPIRFANMLKRIGADNGLALANIKVDNKVYDLVETSATSSATQVASSTTDTKTGPLKEYKATKASFSVIATYPGFLSLLEDVENSLGVLNVTSLTMREYQDPSITARTATSKVPASPLYEYSVELETYSFK